MAAAGMRFACRYLVPVDYAWKRLTRPEAEAITAAGLKIVSVFQRGTNDAKGGAVNGTRDGKAAY
ncbi:glycoside hydrolase domain-containing protein, partial [Brevibacillus massiliensis]|uniref:glycoside hydrolase domain-containing protein n=1 Tax=Brevibacillus massiliensis TaxID=1118054 RepID=UPI001FDECF93